MHSYTLPHTPSARPLLQAMAALALCGLLQPAHALDSVLVTAPVDNQSGRGGYIAFLQPVPALTGNERGAKALGLAAGSAGIGSDPADANVHYVNGTPVAACLYGIDVQAPARWGKAPDLVISGPNEGNNPPHTAPTRWPTSCCGWWTRSWSAARPTRTAARPAAGCCLPAWG